ncbi:carbohydrate ABC transporter membrane protein 2 (CUT1 family) [Antricoccus suffuscus]|uniref:Carbohydrate ABC transporter membrane protein 2 (CUT1 family) n=1 Tax=Antricoccus suffuscus TaxID=1629062 RepID=A0A2T1A747_9ACTN|nr:carbohydrate ABC transporter permease [Antricoccus suffuscus]PRZ44421.1 carbohydrate ABC transporter membrane protein 2 (CUT1 family) [Antricoccus suffuscus]
MTRATLRSHAILGVVALFCLFPVYWLLATSLRRPGDIYSLAPFPWPLTFENYAGAADKADVPGLLINTTFTAVSSTAIQLFIAILSAYGFAMHQFRFKRVLYLAFIATWLIPFQVTMLPNYLLLHQLGLLNTLAGVVLPTMCSVLAVLMLRQHLDSFPKELVAAAKMDGLSSWRTLWQVVVPNLRPALAALSILLFINSWNEYFWPAVVLQQRNAVLQLGLRSFMSAEGNDWGPMMALAAMSCLPVFLLYLAMQRRVVSAFVRSGLK